MDVSKRRRFTLLDAMVLVAATAVGLAWARANRASMAALIAWQALPGRPTASFSLSIRLPNNVLPFLAVWTVALLAVRLGRPSPRYRRLVRRPGFAACYAVVLGLVIVAVEVIPNWAVTPTCYLTTQAGSPPATVLAGAWLTLALGGGWRRDRRRDWIEIAGRALGAGWLAVFAVSQVRF
jgi:hypothetical protein